VKQLKGISGPTPVWDGHGGQILSTPDAIGKVLERYIENREEVIALRKGGQQGQKAPAPAGHTAAAPAKVDSGVRTNTTCPECGSNVEHVSGCVVCYNCGWSKC
jgi:ribonucleoside-diphosphate reductase alpha chain